MGNHHSRQAFFPMKKAYNREVEPHSRPCFCSSPSRNLRTAVYRQTHICPKPPPPPSPPHAPLEQLPSPSPRPKELLPPLSSANLDDEFTPPPGRRAAALKSSATSLLPATTSAVPTAASSTSPSPASCPSTSSSSRSTRQRPTLEGAALYPTSTPTRFASSNTPLPLSLKMLRVDRSPIGAQPTGSASASAGCRPRPHLLRCLAPLMGQKPPGVRLSAPARRSNRHPNGYNLHIEDGDHHPRVDPARRPLPDSPRRRSRHRHLRPYLLPTAIAQLDYDKVSFAPHHHPAPAPASGAQHCSPRPARN